MIHKFLIGLVLVCIGLSANAAGSSENYDVTLAFDKINRFVFPVPYKELIIDYSNGYETITARNGYELLVRPKTGAAKRVQFTIVLNNDDVFQVNVSHQNMNDGVIFRYQNASDDNGATPLTLDDKHRWIEATMVKAHQYFYGSKKVMPGMTEISLEDHWKLRLFNKENKEVDVSLYPRFSWSGMKRTLKAYEVYSNETVEIENSDFYRFGTIAIALESDVVTPDLSPYLFIIEHEE